MRPVAWLSAVLGFVLISSLLVVTPAAAADAQTEAAAQTAAETVSADPLPTVQIDGVVWSQAVAGNTVYVGGEFTNARPAGSAAGTNLSPRANLLAYNLTTGALISSWNPGTNGAVNSVAVSPDGSRVYIAGAFTQVAGQTRYRAASFDTATGQLTSWRPVVNTSVVGIAATNSTVYLTGNFTSVNSVERLRIAAVSASDASLVSGFAPTLEGGYGGRAIVISPDQSKIVVAGSFTSTNGSTAITQGRGISALSTADGSLLQWNVSAILHNGGDKAAMYSLASDGDSVYGSGYDFGGSKTVDDLEGAFRADWSDGTMEWMEDCHGDTYSVAPLDGVMYTSAHTHYCGNVAGGFPQENPWYYNHSLAFDKQPSGTTITTDPMGYRNFAGNPSGKLLHWYPKWTTGTYTGLGQATWNVTSSGNYLLYGGEFTAVAGSSQQGLVRFAKRSIAPNAIGPSIRGGNYTINPASFAAGTARVAWAANYDPDNADLTYQLFRQGVTAPLYTTTATSTYWVRPAMMYMDTGLTAGQTYNYRVRVTDPNGNTTQSDWTPVTVATSGAATAYDSAVLAGSPSNYWPLGESSGTLGYDWAYGEDATLSASGVTRGVTGPNTAEANQATRFSGASGVTGSTSVAKQGPSVFSVEAWFRTTSTAGGKVIGFGNASSGNSTSYDRQIYLSGTGAVTFGVYPGAVRSLTSSTGYNDGQWHYVVGTLDSSGMTLYLDGKRVGSRTDTTSAQSYSGYWRIGGDNLGGWPSTGSSYYLAGDIANAAVYGSALSASTVNDHWVAAGRTSTIPVKPSDSYGGAVYDLDPALYWRVDETSGTTAADSGKDGVSGTYLGGSRVTMGVAGALASGTGTAVTFTPNNSATGIASSRSFSNPTVYSLETWFKTNTTTGGKLIGFGNSQTGTSSNYDRHVYMAPSGQVRFGVYTGSAQIVSSTASYNDNAWHHVVATQSSDGMKLYVDGALVGSNNVTTAQNYVGYWRVGGDAGWEGDTWWRGTVDEVAVYGKALTSDQVQQHFSLGKLGRINQLPTASFVATPTDLHVAFDGSASADPDGTIAQYAWNFGDGSTGTGATPTHDYSAGGSYLVTLTVTDQDGGTGTYSTQVTVQAANVLPTASFVVTQSGTSPDVTLDGSASADSDGSIVTYNWDFGDGTSDSGATTAHTYTQSGDFTITLTVTDNRGGAGTTQQVVHVVRPNAVPVPAFTATPSDLTVAFDASGSSDADNDPLTYTWAFGDSTTGTGVTTTHTYSVTQATTFNVTLTVSDGVDSAQLTKQVSVTPPPAADVLAQDGFERTASGSWGSADIGGSWSLSGGSAAFSVSGGMGKVSLTPGQTRIATLAGVSTSSTVTDVLVSSNVASAGSVAHATVIGRQVGSYFYSVRVRFESDGTLQLQLVRNSGSEAALSSKYALPGTYTPGDLVHVRLKVSGSSPTTVAAKGWYVGSSEPSDWQVQASDSTAVLQAAGSVTLRSAISSSSTVPTTVISYDGYQVTTGQAPAANTAPVAAFSATPTGLKVSVDASASSDADGDSLTYAWDFGDGANDTGKTATHTYGSAGSYDIKLTVSDGKTTGTVTHSVTVAPVANTAPVAKFSTSTTDLKVSVDASASSDADGDSLTYAWDFGDGASDTGKTATHTYGSAGSYDIKLTVSDGQATDTVTHSVTVSAAPTDTVVAADDFGRTVAAGSWGDADQGGTWSLSGGSAAFSVSGGVGLVAVPVGNTREARLTNVTGTNTLVDVSIATDVIPSASGTNATVVARRVGSSYYGARIRFEPGGVARLYLLKDETSLAGIKLSGTYNAGDVIKLEVSVTGTSPTTIAAKAWYAGDTKPTDWQKVVTDATSGLQADGYVGLRTAVGASSTATATVSYDSFKVTRLG